MSLLADRCLPLVPLPHADPLTSCLARSPLTCLDRPWMARDDYLARVQFGHVSSIKPDHPPHHIPPHLRVLSPNTQAQIQSHHLLNPPQKKGNKRDKEGTTILIEYCDIQYHHWLA